MPLYDIVVAPHNSAPALAAMDAPLFSHTGFACRPVEHVKLAALPIPKVTLQFYHRLLDRLLFDSLTRKVKRVPLPYRRNGDYGL
jgi:hypothetical protein